MQCKDTVAHCKKNVSGTVAGPQHHLFFTFATHLTSLLSIGFKLFHHSLVDLSLYWSFYVSIPITVSVLYISLSACCLVLLQLCGLLLLAVICFVFFCSLPIEERRGEGKRERERDIKGKVKKKSLNHKGITVNNIETFFGSWVSIFPRTHTAPCHILDIH